MTAAPAAVPGGGRPSAGLAAVAVGAVMALAAAAVGFAVAGGSDGGPEGTVALIADSAADNDTPLQPSTADEPPQLPSTPGAVTLPPPGAQVPAVLAAAAPPVAPAPPLPAPRSQRTTEPQPPETTTVAEPTTLAAAPPARPTPPAERPDPTSEPDAPGASVPTAAPTQGTSVDALVPLAGPTPDAGPGADPAPADPAPADPPPTDPAPEAPATDEAPGPGPTDEPAPPEAPPAAPDPQPLLTIRIDSGLLAAPATPPADASPEEPDGGAPDPAAPPDDAGPADPAEAPPADPGGDPGPEAPQDGQPAEGVDAAPGTAQPVDGLVEQRTVLLRACPEGGDARGPAGELCPLTMVLQYRNDALVRVVLEGFTADEDGEDVAIALPVDADGPATTLTGVVRDGQAVIDLAPAEGAAAPPPGEESTSEAPEAPGSPPVDEQGAPQPEVQPDGAPGPAGG